MPSDKHNSRTARATDLISSLINNTSYRDVPFHQSQQLQCLHHGATVPLYPFVHPFFRHNQVRWRFAASVWDIKIADALLILFLAYNAMKQVWHCWNWGVMAFMYRDMECAFHEWITRIFCNGWMNCIGWIVCYLY